MRETRGRIEQMVVMMKRPLLHLRRRIHRLHRLELAPLIEKMEVM
jgi:hypothetical protein